jgi:hypothetical protein
VQKLSGDADAHASSDRLHLDLHLWPQGSLRQARRPKHYRSHFKFAKQGNQGRAKDNREDHCTPGNDPNGVPWKNLLRRYSPIRACGNTILEFLRKLRSGFRLRTPASLTPANRLNSGAGDRI